MMIETTNLHRVSDDDDNDEGETSITARNESSASGPIRIDAVSSSSLQNNQQMLLSTNGATQLMELLYHRGYFHNHHSSLSSGANNNGAKVTLTTLYQNRCDFTQPTNQYLDDYNKNKQKNDNCTAESTTSNTNHNNEEKMVVDKPSLLLIPLICNNDNDTATDERFVTIDVLSERFRQLFKNNNNNGRMTIQKAAESLHISVHVFKTNLLLKILQEQYQQCQRQQQNDDANAASKNAEKQHEDDNDTTMIFVIQEDKCVPPVQSLSDTKSCITSMNTDEFVKIRSFIANEINDEKSILITNRWIKCAVETLISYVIEDKANGYISLADVCQQIFQFPLSSSMIVYQIVTQYLSMTKQQQQIYHQQDRDAIIENCSDSLDKQNNEYMLIKLLERLNGSYVVVSNQYLQNFRNQVIDTFHSITDTEVSISQIANQNHWDCLWVMDIIKDSCSGSSSKDMSRMHKGSDADNYSGSNDNIHVDDNKIHEISASGVALQGQIHGDMYIPDQFINQQRHMIWDEYCSNGYVTSNFAMTRVKISITQMKEYLLHQYNFHAKSHNTDNNKNDGDVDSNTFSTTSTLSPPPLILKNIIFHPVIIVTPIQVAIQEAAMSSSFADLKLHIPMDLLEDYTDDIQDLIENYILLGQFPSFASLQEAMVDGDDDGGNVVSNTPQRNDGANEKIDLSGIICINPTGALYFSRSMVENFTKNKLPHIVETFAKERAEYIFHGLEGQSGAGHKSKHRDNVDDEPLSGKEKSKVRKERKARQTSKCKGESDSTYVQTEEDDFLMIPVYMIIDELIQDFRDLKDVVSDIDGRNNIKKNDANSDTIGNTILAVCCQQAFYTSKFEAFVKGLVQSELERLQLASKKSKLVTTATTSRSLSSSGGNIVPAMKVRNVQAAFEDAACFASSCYMIQSVNKFITFVEENSDGIVDSTTIDEMKKEFLLGYCANFTRKLTQYCLYRNNVDDGLVVFQKIKKAEDGDEVLSDFYAPMDSTVRLYENIYVTTDPTKHGGKVKGPLSVLRDILPGSLGVTLARQFMLCGGECYEGGVKKESSGNVYVKPGDRQLFNEHVRENCILLCGLPFTKLDKKSEKKFLTERRLQLMRRLEEATDPEIVFDVSIMLLYQLLRNMVVLGKFLRGPILQMLLQEKKGSDTVQEALCDFSERLQRGDTIENDVVENFKQLCLGREVTKKK